MLWIMRRLFFASLFFVLFLFLASLTVEARSGCCSHHGGVCGCGCCDGSSLSAICAPYYPECSANQVQSEPVYTAPTNTPYVPPPTATSIPTKTPTPTPTSVPAPTVIKKWPTVKIKKSKPKTKKSRKVSKITPIPSPSLTPKKN